MRTVDGIEGGKVHFERAIELDPGFAHAFAGLANAYHLLHEYAGLPESESLDPAMEQVNRALELSPELGEAFMVRGELNRHLDEYAASEVDFERALELIPGNATVYHWYSFLKSDQDKEEEFSSLIRRTNKHQTTAFNILHAIGVIPNTKVSDVVVKRIAGEVAAPHVLIDTAVNVVTNDAPFVIMRDIVGSVIRGRPEGRSFDDLATEAHMCQSKPPADQTTVIK